MDLWRRNVKRRIEMRGGGADSVPVVNNPVFPSPPYPFNDVIMNCNYPFNYMIRSLLTLLQCLNFLLCAANTFLIFNVQYKCFNL